jgi:hypothetical protein
LDKIQQMNGFRKEAVLFQIRSPFRQALYAKARSMGYPPLKAWQASGHCLNWKKARIDPRVALALAR